MTPTISGKLGMANGSGNVFVDVGFPPPRDKQGKIRSMNQTYTAVVKQDGDWWIGSIEEVPGVNCQERTRDELLQSLRVTLGEALAMNRADAKQAAGKDYEELTIAV
jgi:predicted RNase H-like HicB family nuclease